MALTCRNVLSYVLPGRVSGATRSVEAAGHAGWERHSRECARASAAAIEVAATRVLAEAAHQLVGDLRCGPRQELLARFRTQIDTTPTR